MLCLKFCLVEFGVFVILRWKNKFLGRKFMLIGWCFGAFWLNGVVLGIFEWTI